MATKNGQSRDIGNIGYTRKKNPATQHRMKRIKTSACIYTDIVLPQPFKNNITYLDISDSKPRTNLQSSLPCCRFPSHQSCKMFLFDSVKSDKYISCTYGHALMTEWMVGPVPTSNNIFAVMFPEMMLLLFSHYS